MVQEVCHFFVLKTENDDFKITNKAEEKFEAVMEYLLPSIRRQQGYHHMYSIDTSAFLSVNSSLGWLGTDSSRFCTF